MQHREFGVLSEISLCLWKRWLAECVGRGQRAAKSAPRSRYQSKRNFSHTPALRTAHGRGFLVGKPFLPVPFVLFCRPWCQFSRRTPHGKETGSSADGSAAETRPNRRRQVNKLMTIIYGLLCGHTDRDVIVWTIEGTMRSHTNCEI